jgi:hypothetical protein
MDQLLDLPLDPHPAPLLDLPLAPLLAQPQDPLTDQLLDQPLDPHPAPRLDLPLAPLLAQRQDLTRPNSRTHSRPNP